MVKSLEWLTKPHDSARHAWHAQASNQAGADGQGVLGLLGVDRTSSEQSAQILFQAVHAPAGTGLQGVGNLVDFLVADHLPDGWCGAQHLKRRHPTGATSVWVQHL